MQALAPAMPFLIIFGGFAVILIQENRAKRMVDAQVQTRGHITEDEDEQEGANGYFDPLNEGGAPAPAPAPAAGPWEVDLHSGQVAARWTSLRMLLEERLDGALAPRTGLQECLVNSPEPTMRAVFAHFERRLRALASTLGRWYRPEAATPAELEAAGAEVRELLTELLAQVLEARLEVWRYQRGEILGLSDRMEDESSFLGKELAGIVADVVDDMQRDSLSRVD